MNEVRTKIAAGGRIVIPADFRREMGADVGDQVDATRSIADVQLAVVADRDALAVRRPLPVVRPVPDEVERHGPPLRVTGEREPERGLAAKKSPHRSRPNWGMPATRRTRTIASQTLRPVANSRVDVASRFAVNV